MELSWVGKYFIGSGVFYALTAPVRKSKQQARDEEQAKFLTGFAGFPAVPCAEFLSEERYTPDQIPCFFVHTTGQQVHFVYEPACPEKLASWQLDAVSEFIDLYGFAELEPALMLSKDGARDQPIVFLFNGLNKSSYITQLGNAQHLMALLQSA